MEEKILRFDPAQRCGAFKPLNCTNGGPWYRRHTTMQLRTNYHQYRAARIPYARNHDSGIHAVYGGPYSHDISKIFRNFDADAHDPASYDFACTDEALLCTLEAGTQIFFRLGETIEHQIKKHATLPPRDFHKWASICEHIIRHYNEGWADGYHLNIQYWEIWNEPDLDPDDSTNKRTWGGTQAQFFDLYEITAKHLKKYFPQLKIGGPALAGKREWADQFLAEMSRRNVPMDFLSWHVYGVSPAKMLDKAAYFHQLLQKYGYGGAESILNEWNYIRDWREGYIYSLKAIHGMKGAAFEMACISAAQGCPGIDMLMYYDTRPSAFCGAFDFYTYEPLKGYYPLLWYGDFYDMQHFIPCQCEEADLYTLCGMDADGKLLCIVTYYSDDDEAAEKQVRLDFGRAAEFEVSLLDDAHDGTCIAVTDQLSFTMKNCTCLRLKEK